MKTKQTEEQFIKEIVTQDLYKIVHNRELSLSEMARVIKGTWHEEEVEQFIRELKGQDGKSNVC